LVAGRGAWVPGAPAGRRLGSVRPRVVVGGASPGDRGRCGWKVERARLARDGALGSRRDCGLASYTKSRRSTTFDRRRRHQGCAGVGIGVACRLSTASWGLALFASRLRRRRADLGASTSEELSARPRPPSAQEAVRVDAASQVGAQLAFDVARHTAVVRGAGLGQLSGEVGRSTRGAVLGA
jgi:hypothetical protein